MPSKKHYIITAISLALIAGASAGLIGVTNLVTRDHIARNERNKVTSGITSIFGDGAYIKEEMEVKDQQYVNYAYIVTNEDQDECLALRTTGSNMYGKISLIVGFRLYLIPDSSEQSPKEYVYTGLSVIVNEQTYASTLQEEYLDKLDDGSIDLDDVSCGATYGAKLVRDMVDDATKVANEEFIKD